MPLSFSAEELDLLLALAQPIEPAQRSTFLDEVAAASSRGSASRAGPRPPDGAADSAGKFWTPPAISPNATAPVHRGRAA